LIKESKYKKDYIEEILGEFTIFVKENLEGICEDAENQLNNIDKNPKNPLTLRVIYQDFFAKAESELKTLEAFAASMPITMVRDKFAKALRRIGNYHRYYLWDCKKAQEILNEAVKYAGSEMLKETIKNDIKLTREDIIAKIKVGKDFNPSACWFCGSEVGAEDRAIDSITMKMHKIIDIKTVWTGYNTYRRHYTWRPLTITIPRCRNCKKYHNITTGWTIGLGIFGLFLYVVGAIPMGLLGYSIGHFIAAKKQRGVNYDIYTLSTILIFVLGIFSVIIGTWKWSILFMSTIGYMLYNFVAGKLKKEKSRLSIYALILIAGFGLLNISRFGIRVLLAAISGAIVGHLIALKRKKTTKDSVKLRVRPKPYLSFYSYPLSRAARINGYASGEKPAGVS
jgi:hypothetical protein